MPFVQRASRFNKLRGFLILSPLLIFLSCATLSPINSSQVKPLSFADLESVKPEWESFVDGIDFFHAKIATPRLEFWALRVDLSAPQVRVVIKDGAMVEGQTLSAKTSSFVRDNSLIAGINAAPFDISSSKEGRSIKNIGVVISGGEIISPPNPNYDAIIFLKDGSAVIAAQSAIFSMRNIENAVGGFHYILKDGDAAKRTLELKERHPRSAAGISDNGERLYLLVIDGRRPGSVGATEKETALLLLALGSKEGINLDGGGSSALVLRYPDGKARAVNSPIHKFIPGIERAVAACIGIEYTAE